MSLPNTAATGTTSLPLSFTSYTHLINSTIPFVHHRWITFAILIFLFIIRILTYQGFYVIAYGLGIFLLNSFLAFLSPRFDPDLEGLSNDALLEDVDLAADLPIDSRVSGNNGSSSGTAEFRPFERRLPEFQFWYLAIRATVVSLLLSMFTMFDIPVYWPILLIYFVVLVSITMRRQIRHMIKFKYVPFDIGKRRYNANVK